MIKSLGALTGAVALGALMVAAPALADGGPGRRSIKDAPAPAPFTWTGFYLGLHAGVAMTDDTVTDVNGYNGFAAPGLARQWQNSGGNKADLFGGVTAGYNFQFQSIVFGLEGELGMMDVGRSTQDPIFQGVAGRDGDSIASFSADWYGTITGRIGITLVDPRLLLYAKGGWGFVSGSVGWNDTNPTGTTIRTSGSGDLSGAVYGGGLEWAWNRNWSTKIEYLHFDLGKVSTTGVDSIGVQRTFARDLAMDTVKLGINYRF